MQFQTLKYEGNKILISGFMIYSLVIISYMNSQVLHLGETFKVCYKKNVKVFKTIASLSFSYNSHSRSVFPYNPP